MKSDFEATMERVFLAALDAAVSEAREKRIAQSVADFERDLRETIGRTALRISDYYSVRTERNNIVISVRREPDR